MHTATDVYAHSVWTTKYGRLFHGSPNDYADKSNIVKERFTAAQGVAANIIKHFTNDTIGTASDFCVGISYNASIFKLYYFEDYMKSISPTLAASVAAYSIK